MDRIWCDGYRVLVNIGSVEIRFQIEQNDVSTIVISLPVAKSLTASLAQAIVVYEQRTGQNILLPEEIQRRLSSDEDSENSQT